MTKLRCCFCQQELNQDNPQSIECRNDDCKKSYFMYGSKELWQELIRTHKALDVALDWLEQVATPEKCDDDLCCEFTKRKLAKIKTALEQKDVK